MRRSNKMFSSKKYRKSRTDKGFTLIEILIVVGIIGILATFLLPNIVQAHYKARASKIVSDLRIIRDSCLRYHIEKNSWPRSRTWGRIPPELVSYVPPGTQFDIPGWDVSLAFTNYKNKSDAWIRQRGYSVVIRTRIQNIMLANKVNSMAPNLFSRANINKNRGMFFVALE
jgi:prepilin-type N-terminal cleavage/methylation domain-containing protein